MCRRRHTGATTTYVLVPGSFSNSFGLAPMQRELGLRGCRSIAASYPAAYQAPQDPAALAVAPSSRAGVTMALTPDNPFDVHTLETSHAGVLVRPGECAEILTGLHIQ